MLIITGTLAYDYIMDYPQKFSDHILPDKLHKINLSFIVNTFEKRRGGTAGNASYTLGLLKTPHILFSVAGKDFLEYKKAFVKLGIDMSCVLMDKTSYTSTGFAMTDKTDNQIWGYFYGASEKIADLKLKTVAVKKDLVLIGPSGAKASMNFVNQCVELNIPYLFDPGFILTQVSDNDLRYGIKNAQYIIGNDYEMDVIKKRTQFTEVFYKTKITITTLGEKGALIQEKGQTMKIKAATPQKVIDPTGAGDAWRAGFLSGLGKGFDLKTCGQMGSVAASFAVECYGTQEHKFTLKEFENRYRQTFHTLLK